MYLKVRDVANKRWWYVHNFDRLVVDDVKTVEANTADSAAENVEKEMHSHEPNLAIIDSRYASRGNYMRINCITDRRGDQPQKEYSVVLNTFAFMCNDHGHTMDRFIVNRD